MIVPDLNLLLYGYFRDSPHHKAAQQWWQSLLTGSEPVGIPWVVVLGFIRLSTNPRVMTDPLNLPEAKRIVDDWMRQLHVSPLNPGPQHMTLLSQTLTAGTGNSDFVTDAHIAALAIEHHAEVHSNDSDFNLFDGLRWRNPL